MIGYVEKRMGRTEEEFGEEVLYSQQESVINETIKAMFLFRNKAQC